METSRKLIIANWKMNMAYKNGCEFLEKFENADLYSSDILFLPSSLHIQAMLEKYSNLKFGSQDLTYLDQKQGSFTGEISASMLNELGVRYAMCGHSERRGFFKETNKIVYAKAKNALDANITPIICVGENMKSKLLGRTKSALKSQLKACVPETNKKIIVAYEPLWAIGAGEFPPADYLEYICSYLKEQVQILAKNSMLVYGGSVDAKAAKWTSKQDYLDGVLVGGASLKFNEFIKIVKSYD